MYRIDKIFTALFMALLIVGCASEQTVPVDKFSGYLGDYSKLKKTKDERGHDVLRWQSPKLKPGKYKKLMLDNIVFYPAPKTTLQT